MRPSQAVAEAPARAYNPLFLYGGVGWARPISCTRSDTASSPKPQCERRLRLEREVHQRIHHRDQNNKTVEFRNTYRHADVLLIDDIQFLEGKEQTQEEFFHTFNSLYEAQRQLIISSDRTPKEIQTLEDRLRSRFESGPAHRHSAARPRDPRSDPAQEGGVGKIHVPNEVSSFIAKVIPSNIRELEGALIRVVAFASLTKSPITQISRRKR